MGFSVPIGAWLKGPLREWAETLLAPKALEADGLFDARPIRACWDAHVGERVNHEYRLWTILMFQSWRERASV
jgi:asparagine synthase (glutamine-hydrolysing)